MNKLLVFLGTLAVIIGTTFADLFFLVKIYNITIRPLGAPVLGMWQMWMLTMFISACVTDGKAAEKVEGKSTAHTIVERSLNRMLTLLLIWGLASLIFG